MSNNHNIYEMACLLNCMSMNAHIQDYVSMNVWESFVYDYVCYWMMWIKDNLNLYSLFTRVINTSKIAARLHVKRSDNLAGLIVIKSIYLFKFLNLHTI